MFLSLRYFFILATVAFEAVGSQSLTSALQGVPSLSNFTAYLGLSPAFETALVETTNITVLAPSNEAFQKALNSTIGAAIAGNDPATIQALLSYHVLQGTHRYFNEQTGPQFIPTLLNDSIYTSVTDGQRVEAYSVDNGPTTFISGLLQASTATQMNISFDGGIIHIIDTFLMIPSNLSSTLIELGASSTVGALKLVTVNSSDSLSDMTYFVPNNAAWEAVSSILAEWSTEFLAETLEYEILNGTVAYSADFTNSTLQTSLGTGLTISVEDGDAFANSAKILIPNVLIAEGVIHIVDKVLNSHNTTVTPDPHATPPIPEFYPASSYDTAPFTSGIPTPTSSIQSIPSVSLTSATSSNGAPVSGPSTTSSLTPSGSASSGLSTGAKAGIGVGCAFAAILLLAIAFLLLRRRKRFREIIHPKPVELPPPEKDLAVELSTNRDHAAELEGRTVGPEMEGRGVSVKKARPKAPDENISGG